MLVSPCDAIVGAAGTVAEHELLQVKGFPTRWRSCWAIAELVALYRDGRYVTLRLTAGMYHRFHAPHDCRVEQVTHISGDAWNVNPIALKRVEKLFCKNERAVLRLDLGGGQIVTLVPVAAILVAGFRLRFLDIPVEGRDRNWTAHPAATPLRQGRGDGLVRAWLDHHRAGAGRLQPVRYDPARPSHPHGRAAAAAPLRLATECPL